MPIIAVFFGIIVRMFHREHEPVHFHAEQQGHQGKFDFDGKTLHDAALAARANTNRSRQRASRRGAAAEHQR